MISTGLPRWPDRDAAGPGTAFKITVRCDEPQGEEITAWTLTPSPIGTRVTAPTAWQTDWRGGMAVWPDEIADKPDPAQQSWWTLIAMLLFVAANAAIWGVGLARLIVAGSAAFP